MAVITISREFGSGGVAIAEHLAKAIGWPLVDKALLATLLSDYGLIDFDEFYESKRGFLDRFSKSDANYINMLNQAIRAFARHDNVIIMGRGGFALLQDFCNVLNVLIKAPADFRIREVSRSHSLTIENAEIVVAQNDGSRASFLKSFYGASLTDTSLFDLVIDSSMVPSEMAVRWLVEMAGTLDHLPPSSKKHTNEIEADAVLDESVRKILGG